jgi:adenylosuccinate synthase
MIKAVIGLGFGDEGKGATVNWLSSLMPDAIVVRYSGGHQAGHHVKEGKMEHIFSNFGSGTLRGLPTFWSKHCTVDPVALRRECGILLNKGIKPKIYISGKCPITTPYEKYSNQDDSTTLKHGSCGVGVFATLLREKKMYHLLAEDLAFSAAWMVKLQMIANTHPTKAITTKASCEFHDAVDWMCATTYVRVVDKMDVTGSDVIFEGSQGLMLDQDIGFFPHCTPSSVGSAGVAKIEPGYVRKYYTTRAYCTRHGTGPYYQTMLHDAIKPGSYDATNQYNGYQGTMKASLLDLDILKYALYKDGKQVDDVLVVTCLEHMNKYKYIEDGVVKEYAGNTPEGYCRMLSNKLCFTNAVMCKEHVFTNL